MTIMGTCLTTDYEDPNILYNKTKTKVGPENGSVKYAPLQNGAVDSDGATETEPKKSSVLKGDLFMYHDAKTKRQKLLRDQEKKRDRLAQIRSNEAMDEKERLSLRSQSRTTSRQTSPRMGARKNTVHPSDTTDGSGSEGASSGKSGRQAWSPSTVETHIPEVAEENKDVHSEEAERPTEPGNNGDSREEQDSGALPNQCDNDAELNGDTSNKPVSSDLENGSTLPTAEGATRRKGGKSKSKPVQSNDGNDIVISNG